MFGWNHDSMDMNQSKLREWVMDRKAWCVEAHWVAKSRIHDSATKGQQQSLATSITEALKSLKQQDHYTHRHTDT